MYSAMQEKLCTIKKGRREEWDRAERRNGNGGGCGNDDEENI
jgi:hypothetical protein